MSCHAGKVVMLKAKFHYAIQLASWLSSWLSSWSATS